MLVEMLWLVLAHHLTTEPMTGPGVPAAGGGATRVRSLMARPAGPRPPHPAL